MILAETVQFNGWQAFTILVWVLGVLAAVLGITLLVGLSVGIGIGRAVDARDGIPRDAPRPPGSRVLLVLGGAAGAVAGWIVGWNLEAAGDPLGSGAVYTVFLPGIVLPVVWGFLYGAPRSFTGNVARHRPNAPPGAGLPDRPPPPDPPEERG